MIFPALRRKTYKLQFKKNQMKTIKLLIAGMICALSACTSDDNQTTREPENFVLAREISNSEHQIEIYTATGQFVQGHNDIYFKIRDRESGNYLPGAQMTVLPLMQMTMMQHSCPVTAVTSSSANPEIYATRIIFQMAGNDMEGWTLKVDYTLNGNAYSAEGAIDVLPSVLRTVNSFTGSDGSKYVMALVGPATPSVAMNEMVVAVYRMESMMDFAPVSGYTVKIDPRMPGMGNHSSPNNTDLVQSGEFYSGTLSLTMTGLWRINMILESADGTPVKGEAVTETNPQSSLYFELEF